MVASRFVISVLVVVLTLSGCRKGTSVPSEDDPSGALSLALFGSSGREVSAEKIEKAYITPVGTIDLWAFPDAGDSTWMRRLELAIERVSGRAYSPLRGGDRTGSSSTVVLFNEQSLKLKESFYEMLADDNDNLGGMLVSQFQRQTQTDPFTLVVVQFSAADSALRLRQAKALEEWVAARSEPVIVAGNLSLKWDIRNGSHDPAFEALTSSGRLGWVLPEELRATVCAHNSEVINDFFLASPLLLDEAYAEVFSADSRSLCEQPKSSASSRPVFVTFAL